MRLLYWYTQFLNSNGSERQYRGLTHFEINLCTTDQFKYDPEQNEIICMPLDAPLQSDFWGKKIYNLNVLTGNNGSGKTTIMNYIMDTLNELYCRTLKKDDKTIIILEIDNIRYAVILSRQFIHDLTASDAVFPFHLSLLFLTGCVQRNHTYALCLL